VISAWANGSDANSGSGGPRQSASASRSPRGGRLGVALLRLVDERLESIEVEFALADAELVAGRLGLRFDAVLAEQRPQLGDAHLDRLRRGLGWIVAPERVDQSVTRHNAIRVQQHGCEQRTLFRAGDVHRAPVLEHLQRAQDPELHRALDPMNARLRRPAHDSSTRSGSDGEESLSSW